MVAAGQREIAAVAVVTHDGKTPCGMCLQVLFEFAINPVKVPVYCSDGAAKLNTYWLSELMPQAFANDALKRTDHRGGMV